MRFEFSRQLFVFLLNALSIFQQRHARRIWSFVPAGGQAVSIFMIFLH